MSLEYALITDSSLPDAVKKSDHYLSVDKKQWIDLVDYSEGMVDNDPNQKILFLIVAKGTAEQEAEDAKRKKLEQEEWDRLHSEKSAAEKALIEKSKAEQDRLNKEKEERDKLRKKSESIFNALYDR